MANHRPLRILLSFRGVDRKFASIFAAKDNSFYIHPYRPEGQPWRIPRGISSPLVQGCTEIDFESYVEPSQQLHKLSIHPSGFLHVTDRLGERYKSGMRVTSFREMVFPHQVCAIVPCRPDELPAYGSEPGHTLKVPLAENSGPFYLSVAIIQASNPPDRAESTNLIFEDLEFGLALSTHLVLDAATGEGPGWPPFPFLILAA